MTHVSGCGLFFPGNQMDAEPKAVLLSGISFTLQPSKRIQEINTHSVMTEERQLDPEDPGYLFEVRTTYKKLVCT